MTISPDRRAELLNKFPAIANTRPLDPAASTQVQAILRAEDIVRHTWPDELSRAALFDPAKCKPLADRADAAAAEFRRRAALRELRYDTADTTYHPDDPAEHGVVRIWEVGGELVRVVRDRWRENPNRKPSTGEFVTGDLGGLRNLDGTQRSPKCTVGIAKACAGATRLLPVDRGTLVLLFWCCRGCEALAGDFADNSHRTNVKIAELEAALRYDHE